MEDKKSEEECKVCGTELTKDPCLGFPHCQEFAWTNPHGLSVVYECGAFSPKLEPSALWRALSSFFQVLIDLQVIQRWPKWKSRSQWEICFASWVAFPDDLPGSSVANTLIMIATKKSIIAKNRSPCTRSIPISHIITNAHTPITRMFLVSNFESPMSYLRTRPIKRGHTIVNYDNDVLC